MFSIGVSYLQTGKREEFVRIQKPGNFQMRYSPKGKRLGQQGHPTHGNKDD